MKNKMIGRKLTLLLLKQSDCAYRDQFNIPRSGLILLERVLVEIIKTRTVRDYFDSNTKHKNSGFKAVSKDGEEFTCNWDSYPSDSITPTYFWDPSKTRKLTERFADAAQALGWSLSNQLPIVNEKGVAVRIKGVLKCSKHRTFYQESSRCWRCELKIPATE